MALGATRNIPAELARLNAAAQHAGIALACPHQSADEFHRARVSEYLSLQRPTYSYVFGVAALAVGALLIFV